MAYLTKPNLVVDLIHNFYIAWCKRQDKLEVKFENLYKEHKKLEEQYSIISNKFDLALQELSYSKSEQGRINQNSDYIKKDLSLLYKRIEVSHNTTESKKTEECTEDLKEFKKLVKEVKSIAQNLNKINIKKSGKELVLLSSKIVSSTREINSEK